MPERVIERAGEEPTDWTLVVTEAGEIIARRQIPFDGVLRFSTESRRTRPRKNSEFGLDPRTVIDRYARRSGTTTPRPTLIDDVQRALGAVAREETEEEAIDNGA